MLLDQLEASNSTKMRPEKGTPKEKSFENPEAIRNQPQDPLPHN